MGERSEVEGGLASGVCLSLRAIPPPAPILPREVGNLAYFAASPHNSPVHSQRWYHTQCERTETHSCQREGVCFHPGVIFLLNSRLTLLPGN